MKQQKLPQQQHQQPASQKAKLSPPAQRLGSNHVVVHPPSSFVCPLTLQVMEDPVMDQCAHNFERQAILEWLQGGNDIASSGHHCVCPISRKELSPQDLVPNHALAEQIEKWKWKHYEEPALLRQLEQITLLSSLSSQEEVDGHDDDDDKNNNGIEMVHGHNGGSFHDEEIALSDMRAAAAGGGSANTVSSTLPAFRLAKRGSLWRGAYDEVPSDLMLLPQEKRLLEQVQIQEAMEQRRQLTRRCMGRVLAWTLFVAGTLLVIALVLWYRSHA